MAESGKGDAGPKVRGLHDQLEKGSTFLGMLICLEVLTPVDEPSMTFQRSCETVSGTRDTVNIVKQKLLSGRNCDCFQKL